MSSRRFRNLLFRIHTWLGLHLCLLLGLIFATGTLLLYSPELVRINRGDLWLPASDWGQSKVSAGNIYDSLNSEHPDGWVDLITSKPRPWFGRLAYGSWGMANVNTATGEILGYGEGWQVRKVIRGLHDSLFVPIHLARIGVNFLSFIVIVMVVTGLITYRRFWKGYFRLPTRHADRRTRRGAWHRLVGVWAAPFLLASTLGSAVFFFKEIGWEAVTPTVGPLPERAAPLPEGFGGKALDALVSACTAEMPRFRESVVDMPDNAEQAVVISGHDMAVGKMLGWVGCHVDPETSEVVRTVRVSDGNTMASLYAIAVSIHYGAWGGWFAIALWTVGGTLSVFLVFTGAQVYSARMAAPAEVGEETGVRGGTLGMVISGLGVLKWGYLLMVIGIVAMIVYRLIL